ncbi:uncharacterized protein LOC113508015 isoform X2 [Trichoplusia ni]|uniref:Uncharacterized protein LOC113508015 isoform X2 n=1 Tax=Trichoplusia ni TaxID=7111 RepID=A0A7E5X269_TRINI|nr:uncharacterized protein LOC113508015 isoform X2 [Trichoplusia ni]
MLLSLKKLLKWNTTKTSETKNYQKSLLLAGFIGLLEDVLFWRKLWLSLFFMFVLNILFFVSVHRQISLFKFVLCFCITILIIDAFESWLKYKHRTTCLKRLANYESKQLTMAAGKFNQWLKNKWNDLLYLRETNHTKAFILVNISLVIVFLTAKYINGYVLTYLMLMLICIFYKAILPLLKAVKNIKQDFESDNELEGLIPEVSEGDIKILSMEPEPASTPDERQIYDYWKPEEVPLAECSDSSDNSSSLVTNLSMEKMHNLEKDVESSDNSDDEYIPLGKFYE